MERPELRLVGSRADERPRPLLVALLAGSLTGAVLISWAVGADEARRPLPARTLAEAAVERALEQGNRDPQVRETLVLLRRALGRRPLDSRTRVAYASLLLSVTQHIDDTLAAASHAALAARLSPVTVPVVKIAAIVLARSRSRDDAAELVRAMFAYDPGAAAELLSRLESLLYAAQLERGLPDDPDAWLAWSRQLRIDRRAAESRQWIERTYRRWPDHLLAWQRMAELAARLGDQPLVELFTRGRPVPETAAAAPVLMYRARAKAIRDDMEGAEHDIALGIELDPDSTLVRILAGQAYESFGAIDEARRSWNRALFMLPRSDTASRRRALVLLARLETRYGEPARALHLWESLLEIDSGNEEAKRNVAELTGRDPSPPAF